MNFNQIPISTVMLWAKKEQSKWEELIGCSFCHKTYGPLSLLSVNLPYLGFLLDTEVLEWGIESFEDFFAFINQDQNCPENLINSAQELEEILSKNKKIKEDQKAWCKKIGLDFVEIRKLKEIEPYEGALNKVLRFYENNELIPRKDLEWVFNAKGQGLIRDYVLGSSNPDHQGFFKSKSRLQNRKEFTFSPYIGLKKFNYGMKFSISYLHDYLPKATTQSSINSSRILKFKDGDEEAVNFYYENLKDIFQPDVLICCVPSSQTGSWGSGFPKLLRKLNGSFVPLETQISLLKRITTVQKKSHGGKRSVDKELNTTEITDRSLMRDRRVVVIDDVSTTGTSLYAASLKLWDAGANCVAALALSQTR